ncbi:GbsR/MarR family transcriptional regulator [Prauserella muralis]|uniref:MarR family transcriptional regulator n=1 Tax=Prauserella muralis TaxID=588067 RepID=A0A2V4B1K5_9PSEU|nr:MarR family transcriptional regulator [Prauserella muralis]PXY28160.1 MarR family transcriptional regulator [Prauserella muralis]TWE22030.1 TrmB family transcriptional regulator [Prauserella muralis]
MADASDPAERMALILTRGGMQRMTARVLCAVLFADQETITAGEIAERLVVSAGAVSGAIKMLEPVGMIERAPVPGSRRDHYRFPDDGWQRMMSAQNRVVDEMLQAAEEGIKQVAEGGPAERRLADMRDFYGYLMAELPALIERWQRDRAQA